MKARTPCNRPGESPGAFGAVELGRPIEPSPLPLAFAPVGFGEMPQRCDDELRRLSLRLLELEHVRNLLVVFRRDWTETDRYFARFDDYVPPVLRSSVTL